jgi:methylated-DNA-[protein]-cysteine S-methyltransferase
MRTHTTTSSPIGDLTLVNSGGVLCRLSMGRPPTDASLGVRTDAGFERIVEELAAYFSGELGTFTIPTAARGDDFEQRVWALLCEIPFGETRSYGELARALGDPALARDVGSAKAHNPIGIVVPCHRVIGADGSLTGYAGGLDRKRYLLDHERGIGSLF